MLFRGHRIVSESGHFKIIVLHLHVHNDVTKKSIALLSYFELSQSLLRQPAFFQN